MNPTAYIITLAAPAETTRDALVSIGIWLGIIAIAVAGLGFLLILARRHVQSDRRDASAAIPFTLDDLRRMRDAGDLNEDQYAYLRAQILAASQQQFASGSGSSEANTEQTFENTESGVEQHPEPPDNEDKSPPDRA